MKNLKKLTALTLAFIFALAFGIAKPQRVQAVTEIDGSFYELDITTKTATFVGMLGGVDIPIPSEVTYEGDTYTITAIGKGAFGDSRTLTSVTIPASVEIIGDDAFGLCESLKTVTFAEGSKLTTIGDRAFMDCPSLTTVTFGENSQLTTIGQSAFFKCTSLTSIEIPSGVTSIGDWAFRECTSLTEINVADGNTNYSSVEGVLYNGNKTELIKCPIAIKKTSITIPNSVKTIRGYNLGEYGFDRCTGLTSIEIPASVESIEEYAFNKCTGLTSVTFEKDSKLTTIRSSAFNECTSLTSIEIPKGVTTIRMRTFYECTGLESIEIPSSVKNIEEGVFAHCKVLNDIYYGGTKDEWDKVTKGRYWDDDTPTNKTMHYGLTVNLVFKDYPSFTTEQEGYTEALVKVPAVDTPGYTIEGWYKDENHTQAWNFATDKTENTDITLYGKLNAIPYGITYHNADGATNSNPATYTIESNTITLAEPIREGYTFGGWYEDELFTKPVTEISNGSMGDKTFYAKWDKVYSYNVTAETDNQKWQKGSNEPLVITFKSVYHDEDTFSRFESAKVDDNAIIEGKDFEKASGSIIIITFCF
ncbi:MAG: leucine-rich repeat protein [Clostridia bacterium]|nr:leucine-rich repeat protein [Clostridia bacterium]